MQLRATELEELKILKQELEDRKTEIKQLEDQLDEWKGKYYEMLEHLISLKGQLDK